MIDEKLNSITHTKIFMDKWKLILVNVYNYDSYMDYLIVPSLFGGNKILSYVHFLDFSDRLYDNVDDLLELAKDNNYHIRTLNPHYKSFKENDTVNMRLDISDGNIEDIFTKKLHSDCRRRLRQSLKNNFKVVTGKSIELIDEFYIIFSKIMHKHGTPPNTKLFFIELIKQLDAEVIICKLNDKVISSTILIFDDKIASLYWNVIDDDFRQTQIGYFSFWNAVKYSIEKKHYKIFDFGRSSYGGSTYKFKLQWGAKPIKIDIISPNNENVYSKYSLASYIWKKLPKPIVDYIGPKICKYLVDL